MVGLLSVHLSGLSASAVAPSTISLLGADTAPLRPPPRSYVPTISVPSVPEESCGMLSIQTAFVDRVSWLIKAIEVNEETGKGLMRSVEVAALQYKSGDLFVSMV